MRDLVLANLDGQRPYLANDSSCLIISYMGMALAEIIAFQEAALFASKYGPHVRESRLY